MIRVFVVDDSVVVRQIVSDALRSDPALEICGVASNGRVALEKIPETKPDVVTLDIEMPEMDGLTTLSELRKTHPRLPVIMFSTLTERGASATLEALARGASDYVCKPSGQRNVQQTMETIRDQLIPKLHAFAGYKTGIAARKAAAVISGGQSISVPHRPVGVVVIAVSTGGPAALAEVIPHLPAGLRQPVLVVQHMPPVFTKVLAQRLGSSCPLKVREAAHQDPLVKGQVLIAPGDYHMRIAGSPREAWVTLDQQPSENGCRPAADPLFTSAAQTFGASVLGIVMTGLGKDGTKGAAQIRKASGQVWAQDEASSTIWSMPGSVVEAGLAQRVLPLQQIARMIAQACAAGGGGPESTDPKATKKKAL
ncbi:MAG TPA: chemotaxis response regulator protein-glutamate methylesterase [Polyangiales bacterium]|nr:chemotaxis response regulator protein-glutamate methylesterase [Polyangiales bacterium]